MLTNEMKKAILDYGTTSSVKAILEGVDLVGAAYEEGDVTYEEVASYIAAVNEIGHAAARAALKSHRETLELDRDDEEVVDTAEPVYTNGYDPENTYAVIQHGGSSTELYVHMFDCEADAEIYCEDCEKRTFDTEGVEAFPRTKLEQVAPLLYEIVSRWRAGMPCPFDPDAVLAHVPMAEVTGPLIATRAWWFARTKEKPDAEVR